MLVQSFTNSAKHGQFNSIGVWKAEDSKGLAKRSNQLWFIALAFAVFLDAVKLRKAMTEEQLLKKEAAAFSPGPPGPHPNHSRLIKVQAYAPSSTYQ